MGLVASGPRSGLLLVVGQDAAPDQGDVLATKGSGRGGGDAEARSAGLRQALEVGTCWMAGTCPPSKRRRWAGSQVNTSRTAGRADGGL